MAPFPPIPQPENVRTGLLFGVGLGTLALFAGAVALGWALFHPRRAPPPPPPSLGQAEVGIVNQKPFLLEEGAAQLRTSQQERLEGYGWVDRQRGLIHIPLERAMQLVLGQEGG